MPYMNEHPQESEIIMQAGAYEIIMALHELHKQGYELLRLLPGMSPNGCAWRWHIYPKAYMHGNVEIERNGYGEAPSEPHPFGSCGQEQSNISIETLIDAFKVCYPEAIELGHGEDKAYIKWYARIVKKAKELHFPVAFADMFDASKGWNLHGGLSFPPYENIGDLIIRSELAGFAWHDGAKIWNLLTPGKRLRLVREPANKHDKRAVAIYFSNTKIGYIPKKDNKQIAEILDEGKGHTIQARITHTYISEQNGELLSFNIYYNTEL